MERTKHGLYVFPPKKTLIWRRHCSIGQSCCSMTSKQFLESSSGMKFVYPSVRLANQKPGAFVSVRYTNQIALFPFVSCFCFVRAFSFQGHTKIALILIFTSNQTLYMLLFGANGCKLSGYMSSPITSSAMCMAKLGCFSFIRLSQYVEVLHNSRSLCSRGNHSYAPWQSNYSFHKCSYFH